eukprot:6207694-Pleurochrysis_carterae.AAC.9
MNVVTLRGLHGNNMHDVEWRCTENIGVSVHNDARVEQNCRQELLMSRFLTDVQRVKPEILRELVSCTSSLRYFDGPQ